MPKKIIGLFTALLCAVTVAGCSTKPTEPEKPVDDNKVVEPAAKAELQIGQVEAAAHGTKCFTTATVVVEGDKILLAYIDDYQYLSAADATGMRVWYWVLNVLMLKCTVQTWLRADQQ